MEEATPVSGGVQPQKTAPPEKATGLDRSGEIVGVIFPYFLIARLEMRQKTTPIAKMRLLWPVGSGLEVESLVHSKVDFRGSLNRQEVLENDLAVRMDIVEEFGMKLNAKQGL